MSAANTPSVLIALAVDGDGAARLPKLFHDAGASVTLVSPPGYRATYSRYVNKYIPTVRNPAAIVETMRKVMSNERFDSVIIASDLIVYEIYNSSDTAWIQPYLPVAPHLAGSVLAGKNAFLELCRSAQIEVPDFALCTSLDDALAAAERIGYPVMLKLDRGSYGRAVRLAKTPEEIRSAFTGGFLDKAFAVQRWIDGRVGTSAILYRDGEPLYMASAYAHRCWPTPFSPQTARRIVQRPVFKKIAEDIGRLTQYDGMAGIDWIEDDSGRVYVLELNARPTPMHVIAPSLPAYAQALRAMLHGNALPHLPERERDGQLYLVFPTDMYRVFAERDLAGIASWLARLPFSRSVPWDDLPLLRVQLCQLAGFCKRQAAGITLRAFSRLCGAIVR